ncbi:hypothetical protein RCO28_20060 [Streptomyces sp. LHD-70]|uniref:hypothetical protein n=1 Tax=Streptomyces sp. LHD-70 TaxID=3072140 RepID=UPI00280C8542|nr:hypothetical protein [Streptomyces sp. LHD-70]MDQ8704770.1 hypothetical protein [Streptomyces sp. LHD-70]
MTRNHHFHLDFAGHSVTVNVHNSHRVIAELLVDGKVTDHQQSRGHRPLLLSGELADEPSRPVGVRVLPGPGVPRCTAVIDGTEELMSPRAF